MLFPLTMALSTIVLRIYVTGSKSLHLDKRDSFTMKEMNVPHPSILKAAKERYRKTKLDNTDSIRSNSSARPILSPHPHTTKNATRL